MNTTLLARQSSSRDERDPATQFQHAEAYADRLGWNLVSRHVEKSTSGGRQLEKRPGLLAALTAMKMHDAFSSMLRDEAAARDVTLRLTSLRSRRQLGVGTLGESAAEWLPALFTAVVPLLVAFGILRVAWWCLTCSWAVGPRGERRCERGRAR